jgi:MAP/microtubule affinity-regulating kinase
MIALELSKYSLVLLYVVCLPQGCESASSTGRVSSSRSRTSDEPHIGKYKLLKTIGKGNFAKVKLAKHVPTGKEASICIVTV